MIPNNDKVIDIESIKTKRNIALKTKNTYYNQNFYVETFYSEKDLITFCKAVERLIRRSDEYSAYIGYLKRTYDLNACSFLNNINDEMATIEMHHYPFTLFEIVQLVTEKMIHNKEEITSFIVADKVIKLHYLNKIGVVPLSKTVHELVHDGDVFINFNQVFGRFDEFVKEYSEFMSPKLIQTYNTLLLKSQEKFDSSLYDILNYQPIKAGEDK